MDAKRIAAKLRQYVLTDSSGGMFDDVDMPVSELNVLYNAATVEVAADFAIVLDHTIFKITVEKVRY